MGKPQVKLTHPETGNDLGRYDAEKLFGIEIKVMGDQVHLFCECPECCGDFNECPQFDTCEHCHEGRVAIEISDPIFIPSGPYDIACKELANLVESFLAHGGPKSILKNAIEKLRKAQNESED